MDDKYSLSGELIFYDKWNSIDDDRAKLKIPNFFCILISFD